MRANTPNPFRNQVPIGDEHGAPMFEELRAFGLTLDALSQESVLPQSTDRTKAPGSIDGRRVFSIERSRLWLVSAAAAIVLGLVALAFNNIGPTQSIGDQNPEPSPSTPNTNNENTNSENTENPSGQEEDAASPTARSTMPQPLTILAADGSLLATVTDMSALHPTARQERRDAYTEALPQLTAPIEFTLGPDQPEGVGFFVHEVVLRLLDDERIYGSWPSEVEKFEAIESSGLTIATTLDSLAQTSAMKTIAEYEPADPESYTTNVVTLDTTTGAVIVLASGTEYQDKPANMVVAARPPGSAFTPIVYATAFEWLYQPSDLIRADGPCSFHVTGQKSYVVGGSGSDRLSLATSLQAQNTCAAVRLGLVAGNDEVVKVGRRLGLDTLTPETAEFYSLPLGVVEMAQIDLLSAYAAFANDGLLAEPYLIDQIFDNEGVLVYEHQIRTSQAISTQTARALTSVLVGNVDSGSAQLAQVNEQQVAGIIGTTTFGEHSQFIGYSPYYATSVLLASEGAESLDRLPEAQLRDGTTVAELWKSYNERLHQGLDKRSFVEPVEGSGGRFLQVDPEIELPLSGG